MTNKNQKELIIQSNKLVEAHYRLTLQEKRLVLWLIKSINRDDVDFKKYKLTITDFADMMGFNPKTQYKEMRKITKALISRTIELEDTETNVIIQMAWLCFVRWEPKKGVCFLEFHPELKPYLLQLQSQFTQIGFADLLGLKSVYAVRLFELLCQYEPIGKRFMSVDDLRLWCGLHCGEYELYADLKKRILNKAKSEINSKTDYEVNYKEVKESRKVTAIEWTIKKKTTLQKLQKESTQAICKELRSKHTILEQMREYGFSKQGATRALNDNEESDVVNAMKAVEIQVQRGKVRNPKAMLVKAIQEKWHPERYKPSQKSA